jgi:hypothetical protein
LFFFFKNSFQTPREKKNTALTTTSPSPKNPKTQFQAFVIKMPTLHRLAVFRDDVCYAVFLYQRWIYRVDRTRANEFGWAAEPEAEAEAEAEPAAGEGAVTAPATAPALPAGGAVRRRGGGGGADEPAAAAAAEPASAGDEPKKEL